MSRLSLVAMGDGSLRPLSEKLLDRSRLLRRLPALIPHAALCHLIPYTRPMLELDIAVTLMRAAIRICPPAATKH